MINIRLHEKYGKIDMNLKAFFVVLLISTTTDYVEVLNNENTTSATTHTPEPSAVRNVTLKNFQR